MGNYTYKFLPASMNAGAKRGSAPKNTYIELFQETLNEQFYNTSDWWLIEEETSIGSNVYVDTDVRINHVINAETGLKLGDDWKTILFKDLNHPLELGRYYTFDSNTWIVINTEILKNIAATCTVRRCNNTLRWVDESTGYYYNEPCAIEYEVKEPRDYITQGSPFPTPGGYLHIYTQLNDRTNKINENQRFLFGNEGHWTCYKVVGTGINDFRNVNTFDNDSAHVLTLELTANFVNEETDDIVNGIADVYTNVYTVIMSTGSIVGVSGSSYQLTAGVLYNGDNVIRNMEWSSSNTRIASVSGSGLVTFNSSGSCTITATVEGNPAYADCLVVVDVIPTDNLEIQITPNTNYVLEGSSRSYAVYLYKNNIQQADAFTMACSGSDVPSTSYTFLQTDGNHFTLSNILRSVNSYLTIQCTTGSLSPKSFNVYLRGAWQFDKA